MKRENGLGMILVFAGTAWILDGTGLIRINWTKSFETLWPVILIAIGLNLMTRKRKRLNIIIWLLTFAIFIGFGIRKGNEPSRLFGNNSILDTKIYQTISADTKPFEKEVPLPKGTEKGKMILNLGAVNLSLSKGRGDLFVKVDSNIPNLKQHIFEGKQAIIEYNHEKYDLANVVRNFNLQMNPELPWEIEANLGAADGKLDLSGISVEKIDLAIGAGDIELYIGEQEINTDIYLRAGVAELVAYIPEKAGLKVKSGNFLTDVTFDNIALECKNGEYQSENYKKAGQNIVMDIITGISAIKIFTYK